MSPTTDPVAELRAAVAAAAAELSGNGVTTTFSFDRPPKPEFGDYSTNAAMLLAPTMGEQPRAVAERLGGLVEQKLADEIDKVDVAGPGFLNLFMSDAWWRDSLKAALAAAEGFGGGTAASAAEKILVEFVSANPTGPITVASARHAAYGDSLSRILEFAGHDIEREYYVNDAGGQVQRFAQSIQARARGEEPPEDGYHGGYVGELAQKIEGAADMDLAELARRGIDLMVEDVRGTLERFGVHMDLFFFEHTVHDQGEVEHALEILDEHGHIYWHEDAVWLRTTSFGDDKDRVLRRSTGEFTYFAPDIAYHVDKRERGFDRLIDVWGADHHGYQKRMLAAWEALGGEPGKLELIIMQLVNLVERGQRVQMSKRRGEFITLDDLIDDIGVDAARYFLLQRSHDTTLDLDLTLAREQSRDNPVYYVQYAHARIASILRKAGDAQVGDALAGEYGEELHPSERALLKRLLAFPDEVTVAAARRAPHRLTTYAHDAAQDFTRFYEDCRVVGAAEEGGDEKFRIALCVMTQRVIARSLGLLGVSAPEQM
jgi:arginyl-tRNA synthetase